MKAGRNFEGHLIPYPSHILPRTSLCISPAPGNLAPQHEGAVTRPCIVRKIPPGSTLVLFYDSNYSKITVKLWLEITSVS